MSWTLLSLLLVQQVSTSSAPCALHASVGEEAAMFFAARGLDALSRGELELAVRCLEAADRGAPDSSVIHRDLALAYAQVGKRKEALVKVDRAIELGDADPDVHLLRAILLAELGEDDRAREAALQSASWEGDLVGTMLGERESTRRLTMWVGERSVRGALATLALAVRSAEDGERSRARQLAGRAVEDAENVQSPIVLNAARALQERLGGGAERFRGATRLRATMDYAHNPSFDRLQSVRQRHAARASLLGEASLQLPIETARLDASLRVDQHIHMTGREVLADFDLTTLSAALALEIPIGRGADAALVGVGLRFADTFGDLFRLHYGYGFEGGPWLEFSLIDRLRVVVAISGLYSDFVDLSPPDTVVSAHNRDAFGQRATVGFLMRETDFDVRLDAVFHRDNALGDAFDNYGAGLATRAVVRLPGDAILRGGLAVMYRRYGPVGDEAIIGEAARRSEARLSASFALLVPLEEHIALVVEDTLTSNFARQDQTYASNVLSGGVELSW
jgi:Tfp pilus assembly protein PilF